VVSKHVGVGSGIEARGPSRRRNNETPKLRSGSSFLPTRLARQGSHVIRLLTMGNLEFRD